MLINNDSDIRIVDDYDLIFLNGLPWPITVDTAAGDVVDFSDPTKITVKLAPRQGPSGQLMPAEEQTIYTQNLIIVQHRRREVIPLAPEQKEELKALLKQKVSKTIH